MSAAFDLRQFTPLLSLEKCLTSPFAFNLTTASPLQRAICRLADGLPLGDLALLPEVKRALGMLPPPRMGKPKEMGILSGIRSGKSLFAAAYAANCTQKCDVSRLGPGEVPRVSIVSLVKDLADVVFGHVCGRILESPLFSSLVIGKPTADTIRLAHPTGRPIEIKVVAGSRAGATLVARWSAGVIFDEFPRMIGEADGVVNWDDSRKAVIERLLPNCGIINIGSPWAPFGPAFAMVEDHWGKPTSKLVVLKCPAYDLNPVYWTSERVAEAEAGDPDVFRTDVMGEFSTPMESFFSGDALAVATRVEPRDLSPEPGLSYSASMDPATRGNGWTLTIWTRKGRRKICAVGREWIGSRAKPLSPRVVMSEIAGVLLPFGVRTIDTDQYMGDALADIAREFGLLLVQWTASEAERVERYQAVKTRIEVGEIEFPPQPKLRADLLRVRKRVTQRGITIDLPLTSDGRHCDFAPSVILGVWRYIRDEIVGGPRKEDAEAARMRKEAERRFGKKGRDEW